MSKFQIITLAFFVVCIIAGLIAFATYKGKSSSTSLPSITVWGTVSDDVFNKYVSSINNTLEQTLSITYVEKSSDAFSQEFIAALARGSGPDAILIPAELIWSHSDKLSLIPYSAFPKRSYMESYIDEASVYLTDDGIMGLPFIVDPMVMYWNKDMFSSAGLATYPRYWDEFTSLNQKLTIKDSNDNIRKSTIAIGEFSNVLNSRELLGTLMMQIGNPVTAMNNYGQMQSAFKSSSLVNPTPAFEFFTKFVNPSGSAYSWNRGMPSSKTSFLAGNLATYFGFASELKDIRSKNPNLNFDVSMIPQIRPQEGKTNYPKITYGKMYGFSIVKAGSKQNSAYQIISTLLNPTYLKDLSDTLYLPTVRRDMIASGDSDPYISIFNQSALISRTWLDIDPSKSRELMASAVNSITSGKKTMYQSLQDLGDEYDIQLSKSVQ